MDNPFQLITDAFHPDYRVNLSIQGLDGTIMLTLSNESGVVAKRLLSAESIQFGIAIEQGHSAIKILAAMTDGDLKQLSPPPTRTSFLGRPQLTAGI
jgi:hypothetical protein